MNKLIDAHINTLLLFVTIPPPPNSFPPDGRVDKTKDRPLQRSKPLLYIILPWFSYVTSNDSNRD